MFEKLHIWVWILHATMPFFFLEISSVVRTLSRTLGAVMSPKYSDYSVCFWAPCCVSSSGLWRRGFAFFLVVVVHQGIKRLGQLLPVSLMDRLRMPWIPDGLAWNRSTSVSLGPWVALGSPASCCLMWAIDLRREMKFLLYPSPDSWMS